MIVIGFTGPAGAGKDTAAKLLAEHLVVDRGLKVRIQAWANILKHAAARSLGFEGTDEECIEFCDWLKVHARVEVVASPAFEYPGEGNYHGVQRAGISGREFLERFGTEGGRDVYGENHWVDLALPSPADARSITWRAKAGFPNVVIDTTTRFPNEAARIREYDGQVWRIERPEAELRAAVTGHVSRAGIPAEQCEVVLQNDSDIDALAASVRWAFREAEVAGDIKVPV